MTNQVMIKPEDVKQLREQTGAGIMDCKRALEASGGDFDKAIALAAREGPLDRRQEGRARRRARAS